MSCCLFKTPVMNMDLLDDCDVLFMVLVMRHHSGKSVGRSTSNLVDSLVADLILVSATMLRKTSSASFMAITTPRLARWTISLG